MRSPPRAARGLPALTLAPLLGAAPTQTKTAAEKTPAPLAQTSPTGFAAVDALGRNGTTGGAGGPCETNGTVTEPRTYHTSCSYTPDPATDVPSLVLSGAGVGKIGT